MAGVAVANKSCWRPRLARLDSKFCPIQYKHFGPLNILWAENVKVQPTWVPFDFLDKDYGRAVLLDRPSMVECRPVLVGWARCTYFYPWRAWGRLSADVNLDLWIFQWHLCFFFFFSPGENPLPWGWIVMLSDPKESDLLSLIFFPLEKSLTVLGREGRLWSL